MASDSNLESLIPEIKSEASLSSWPTPKHQLKLQKFCHTVLEEEKYDAKGRLLYHCNQCKYKVYISLTFWYHYQAKHKIIIESKGRGYYMKRADEELQLVINQVQNSKLSDKILWETLDKKVIKVTLLELLIIKNIPFQTVESQEFQTFCHALN